MKTIVEALKGLLTKWGGTGSPKTVSEAIDALVTVAPTGGGGGSDLPEVTDADNGDVLTVVEGVWAKADPPSGLPAVTSSDNGDVLTVQSGAWAKTELVDAFYVNGGTLPAFTGTATVDTHGSLQDISEYVLFSTFAETFSGFTDKFGSFTATVGDAVIEFPEAFLVDVTGGGDGAYDTTNQWKYRFIVDDQATYVGFAITYVNALPVSTTVNVSIGAIAVKHVDQAFASLISLLVS